jgi:hypothetical protein
MPAFAVMALVCVVLAMVDFPLPWPVRIVMLLAGVWFVYQLFAGYEIAPDAEGELGAPRPKSASLKELQHDEKEVYARYSKESLAYFVNLLTGLPLFLQRVNETAECGERYLHLRTSLTFRLGGLARTAREQSAAPGAVANQPSISRRGESVLVPLIITRRGDLFDNLRVTDANGDSVPTLSQRESRGLLIAALRMVFALALRESRGASGQGNLYELKPIDLQIMWDLIAHVVCHGEKLTEQYRQVINEKLATIEYLSADISPHWRRNIKNFCRVFSEYYVIAAAPVCPGGQALFLTYEHDVPSERPHRAWYDRLRARFGMRQYSVDVVLTRVLQADSYHFQLSAPTGQYIFDHRVGQAHSDHWLKQEDFIIGNEQQYARTYYQSGRPTAHLYVRRQGTALPDKSYALKTRVDFREVPPGALGIATLLAAVSAVVQVFITLTHAGLDPGSARVNTDITAFLLAAPAFAGVMLGGLTGPANVAGSSLSAYFGIIITMGLSLASALSYIWAANGGHGNWFTVTLLGERVVLHLSYVWAPIAMASVLLLLYLAHKTHHEIRYYLSLPRVKRR